MLAIPNIQIIEYIGKGVCGYVLKGKERYVDRTVAIKLFESNHHSSEDAREHGFSEARKAAGLDHTNIVRIYFANIDPHDRFYVVME